MPTLSETEERVISRVARADRAYWRLVRRFDDDPRRRLAIFTRRIEVAAALRGDQRPLFDGDEPVDLWLPLEQAVSIEMRRRRPGIRLEVAFQRERKRLGVGCGRTQLVLSYVARARRKLRRIIWSSGLSIREVSEIFGIAASTIENHLAGARPSRSRLNFYQRLEAITCREGLVFITLRQFAPTRKKFGWRKPLEEHDDDED